jgi:flagellar biosynthesis anti-sigma factor FlgM
MKKSKKKRPEAGASPSKRKGNKPKAGSCWPSGCGAPDLQKDDKLIEKIRQIIAETPEVRPEKVEPLREAVGSGTYGVDPQKLATCLISKLILES